VCWRYPWTSRPPQVGPLAERHRTTRPTLCSRCLPSKIFCPLFWEVLDHGGVGLSATSPGHRSTQRQVALRQLFRNAQFAAFRKRWARTPPGQSPSFFCEPRRRDQTFFAADSLGLELHSVQGLVHQVGGVAITTRRRPPHRPIALRWFKIERHVEQVNSRTPAGSRCLDELRGQICRLMKVGRAARRPGRMRWP